MAVRGGGEEAADYVGAVKAVERGYDSLAVGTVIPEKILALGEFLFGTDGGEYLLSGVGMAA